MTITKVSAILVDITERRIMPREKITGDRIKVVREALGMTQKDLSVELDIHEGCVSRWENGHQNMTDTGCVEKFKKLEAKAKEEADG